MTSGLGIEKLGRLADLTTLISSGSTPKGGAEVYLREGPVMLIRSQNVRMNELSLEDVAYITAEMDAGMARARVQNGDVLLNITGASIGRVASFELRNVQANVNQHVCVIRPKPDKLSYKYLSHLLATSTFQTEIDRLQHGGTRQALTFSQIAEFKIPLPSLSEQRRIADLLDRAEALRSKRRAAIAEFDALKQSLFLSFFGNPQYGTSQYPLVSLSSVCDSINDGTHKTPNYVPTGIPFVTVRNIVTGTLDLSNTKFISDAEHAELTKRTKPERGDILVSKDGTIGAPCPVETEEAFSIFVSVALLKLKTNLIDQKFLVAQLKSAWLQHQIQEGIKGIAIRHLHIGDFKRLKILLPPLRRQRDFALQIASVEQLQSSQKASLTELDALFASLQHRAFRGEL